MSASSSLRLLCMGDNHGEIGSLEQVVKETEGKEFDFIIHVGDITNTWFDGEDEGREQLEAVIPLFETLTERGELLYIWGNRDMAIGPNQPFQEIDIPGTFIPANDVLTLNGQNFTQDQELVEDGTILVNHYWFPGLLENFEGKAYFSGHIHTGRYKDNILNTAFLYRTSDHGAADLVGGYFIVEIDTDRSWNIDFHNMGNLQKGICPEHHILGVQFVPDTWRKDCQFCYDEDNFYGEIAQIAEYGLAKQLDEATVDEVVDYANSLFDEKPRAFSTKLTRYLKSGQE